MSIKIQSEKAHNEPDPDDLERRLEAASSIQERVAILSPFIEQLPPKLRSAAAYDQAETHSAEAANPDDPLWIPD